MYTMVLANKVYIDGIGNLVLDSRPDWELRRTCAAPAPGLRLVLHFIDSCFLKMQTEDIDCLLYDCMLELMCLD